MLRTACILPARLEASRLPRKLLLKRSGKYVIQHVHERIQGLGVARVVIATDSEEILAAAREFGAEALMTDPGHQSGTDRVAEAARLLADDSLELIVNVQGDEPEIDPEHVQRLIRPWSRATHGDPGRAPRPRRLGALPGGQLVRDAAGYALYFSRAPIPAGALEPGSPVHPLRHVGVYAFRPDFLQAFCKLDPAPLERVERLEQLRALYHGHRIRVAVVEASGARGIDTPEDHERFLARLTEQRGRHHEEREVSRTPRRPDQAHLRHRRRRSRPWARA
ncbi:MAG: 3-deoxy-manno-octulosonate cytidylyltransferase [Planctomycetota bacterium]